MGEGNEFQSASSALANGFYWSLCNDVETRVRDETSKAQAPNQLVLVPKGQETPACEAAGRARDLEKKGAWTMSFERVTRTINVISQILEILPDAEAMAALTELKILLENL